MNLGENTISAKSTQKGVILFLARKVQTDL